MCSFDSDVDDFLFSLRRCEQLVVVVRKAKPKIFALESRLDDAIGFQSR